MKKLLFILLMGICQLVNAQDFLIGTPSSLYVVYNYPDNHFYFQLQGENSKRTETQNLFIIDNKMIQLMVLPMNKFVKSTQPDLSFSKFISTYIAWEVDYINNVIGFSNINSKIEILKSNKGRDVALWIYDSPKNKAVSNDSTQVKPVLKQVFMLTRIKNYVIGINSVLFDAKEMDKTKTYLMNSIDGIVERDKEIDADELNKQVNSVN